MSASTPAPNAAHSRRSNHLTRPEIFRAALGIVDAQGLEALTMRRLAADLGVEAMSLYHHVANKDALLDGVVETVLTEMTLADPIPEDWMDLVESMLFAFRSALARHPNTIPILVTRPLNTSASADYVEAPVRAIAGAGFTPQQTGELYQALLAYTFGHALLSATIPPASPESSPLRDAEAAKRYAATLEMGDRPRTFDEAGFRHAARILLRGFADECAG